MPPEELLPEESSGVAAEKQVEASNLRTGALYVMSISLGTVSLSPESLKVDPESVE